MSELEGWEWAVPPTGDVSETDPELVRELEEQEAAENATAADLVAAAVAAPLMPAPPVGVEVPAVGVVRHEGAGRRPAVDLARPLRAPHTA